MMKQNITPFIQTGKEKQLLLKLITKKLSKDFLQIHLFLASFRKLLLLWSRLK